jgi:plasmid maintenance system antidote protein VapI
MYPKMNALINNGIHFEFAKKLNISQTNISAMKNGKRTIGTEFAKRAADLFGLDYRIFL